MDLDDFRNINEEDESGFSYDDIAADDDFELGRSIDEEAADRLPKPPFLGMQARERMVLAMMLFFNVLVLGVGLLLATGRIG